MSREEFIEKNQKFVNSLVYGLLIWIFGVAVFLPMASIYVPDWGSLIATVFIIVLTYFLFSAVKNSEPIFEYVSERLTNYYLNWRKIDSTNQGYARKIVKKTLKISLIILIYFIYRPLIWVANPVLAGLALIIIILLIITQIFSKK